MSYFLEKLFLVLSENISGANLLSGPIAHQKHNNRIISTVAALPNLDRVSIASIVWWGPDIHSILLQYGSGTTITLVEEKNPMCSKTVAYCLY